MLEDEQSEEDLAASIKEERLRSQMPKLPSIKHLLESKQEFVRERLSRAHGKIRLSKHELKKARIIAQVDCKFILVECQGALVAIDQHALHERLNLEHIEAF